jgi:uncharacterized membrane protein YeiH
MGPVSPAVNHRGRTTTNVDSWGARQKDDAMDHVIAAVAGTSVTVTIGAHAEMVIFVCGVFVFGLSGGLAGALKHLDPFGVVVLAGVVGLAGGAIRDIFLGIPAAAIFDWRAVLAVVAAGVTAYVAHRPLLRLHYSIQVLDAVGLSLFSVIGADVSLNHHAGPLAAALLGLATGVGGGVVRDMILNEVPQVLRAGLYAVPSLMASGLVVLGYEINETSLAWYALAAGVCLVVRLVGIVFDINLPPAK